MSYSSLGISTGSAAAPQYAPPSVAALCKNKGGVDKYVESGFQFKVTCGDGYCYGGAEQETKCVAGAGCQPVTKIFGIGDELGPPGVYQFSTAPMQMCKPPAGGEDIARICNTSRDPRYCFYANMYNQAYDGQGTSADVNAWRAWATKKKAAENPATPFPVLQIGPAAAPPTPNWRYGITAPLPTLGPAAQRAPDAAPPGITAETPFYKRPLYIGLAVAAVVVIGGGVYWKSTQKAPKTMAANRRRRGRR